MTKKTFQIAVISASILLTGLFRLLGQTAEQWLKDVDTLTALIEKHHPKPWEKISREKFMKQAEGIKVGLPDWSVEKITIELMGLVASLGDGHSEILLNGVERFNLWFPLRMESFHDGVFITACDEAHGELLGAQVLKLDGTEMKEALKKIGVITPKDSDIAASRLIANYLPNAVILKTLQITEKSEAMQLEVLDAGGNIKSVSISSSPWGMTGNWTWNKTAVPTKNKKVSIYQEHQDKLPHYLAKMVPLRIPYWFELYDDKKLLFFQWNQIANWRLELRESQGNILSENTLNILGYEMLRKGKNQDAAEIFRINTRLYPEWAIGYDSLGEAYLKANDKKNAREAYEEALKLDPGLSSAKLALEQLNKEKIKTK